MESDHDKNWGANSDQTRRDIDASYSKLTNDRNYGKSNPMIPLFTPQRKSKPTYALFIHSIGWDVFNQDTLKMSTGKRASVEMCKIMRRLAEKKLESENVHVNKIIEDMD